MLMGQLVDLSVARERRAVRTEARSTKTEIAGHFAVSVRTVSRWMNEGMPYDKPYEGGVPRFVLRECEAWYSRRR